MDHHDESAVNGRILYKHRSMDGYSPAAGGGQPSGAGGRELAELRL